MRLCKFLFTLAILSQCPSMLRAQVLTDGQCTVPLNAGQFRSIVENAGVQEFVDFAISAPLLSTSPDRAGCDRSESHARRAASRTDDSSAAAGLWVACTAIIPSSAP